MSFTKSVAIGAFLATTLIAGTAFAKGHDQGFGVRLAGPATAGKVDDGQSNRDGDGSATSYGQRDARLEAMAGTQDNSEVAQDRDAAGHPSNKNDSAE